MQENYPDLSVSDIFYRFYPYKLFLNQEGNSAVEEILKTFGVLENNVKKSKLKRSSVKDINSSINEAEVIVNIGNSESRVKV